jgi:hypothetical protein
MLIRVFLFLGKKKYKFEEEGLWELDLYVVERLWHEEDVLCS